MDYNSWEAEYSLKTEVNLKFFYSLPFGWQIFPPWGGMDLFCNDPLLKKVPDKNQTHNILIARAKVKYVVKWLLLIISTYLSLALFCRGPPL